MSENRNSLRSMARPERFELPTLWFEASCSENPNGLCGVAYESGSSFRPAQWYLARPSLR